MLHIEYKIILLYIYFQIPQGMFDRNMARHSKFSMMQHLQNKRYSNMRLQRMKSVKTMPQRALSWSEDDSDICLQRGSGAKLKPKTRSATVDISPTSPERFNVLSFDSQMMDTVFEEDETEAKPLLQKENKIQASNNVESSKPKNESTGITVMTVEDLGDTICVEHKKPVSSSQPSKEQTNVSAVTAQEEGDEPPPTMSSRKNSSHVLTRQGAMEDVPMKRINRANSQ